jgi:UDP-GlcNAc:undecaprenyl-phosphate/decaprenyl-phosphate GlcNAc-1-phosphate transferase
VTLLLAVVVGFLAGRLLLALLGPLLGHPFLERENYRGHVVSTAAGVVVPLALVLVEAGRAVAGAAGVGRPAGVTPARGLLVLAAASFAILGLLDDLVGSGDARGFRGHLVELVRGHLTTGGLKLLGGAAAGLLLAGPVDGRAPARLVADAALIALSANLANQLDRRPGRVLKSSALAFAALALATRATHTLVDVALVVGAALTLLRDDLGERLMIGDAGANPVGACLGLGLVLTVSFPARVVALAVVGGLNLVGEVSSFTRLIDALPPLRAIDRAGRRP